MSLTAFQRLSTIFEFVGVLKNEDDTPVEPNTLKATEYLPSLAGLAWDGGDGRHSLSPDQQRLIKRAAIDIKIVTRESDEDAKFDLFQRLNTGGSQLSDQEVRNCLLIMVSPDFYRWLDSLRGDAVFQQTIAISDRAQEEQYDAELALRFLALKDADSDALRSVGDMSDFLDRLSVGFAGNSEYNRDAQRGVFSQTFALLSSALGDEAFRRYDEVAGRFLGGFSVSAFEAITVGIHANLDAWSEMDPTERDPVLRERAELLWQDEEFRNNSGSGIRASGRIPKTIPRGRKLFTP